MESPNRDYQSPDEYYAELEKNSSSKQQEVTKVDEGETGEFKKGSILPASPKAGNTWKVISTGVSIAVVMTISGGIKKAFFEKPQEKPSFNQDILRQMQVEPKGETKTYNLTDLTPDKMPPELLAVGLRMQMKMMLGREPTEKELSDGVKKIKEGNEEVTKLQKEMLAYIKEGNLEGVKDMVENRGINANLFVLDQNKSMILCIELGKFNIFKYLAENGAEIEYSNIDGETPLMIAVKKDRENFVDYLIAKNVDITEKTDDGKSVFDLIKNTEKGQIIKKKLLVYKKNIEG